MKVLSKIAISLMMLMLLAACGNDNKSGKSSSSSYDQLRAVNSRCATSFNCSISQLTGLGVSYNGVTLRTVVQENTCLIGSQQRMQVSYQISLPYVVQQNDVYVGVTSYGDVGVVVGNGTSQASFTAYLCVRNGQPASAPTNVSLGVATKCRFKTMYAANLAFSTGEYALFRYLDGGSSAGRAFSVCY